MNKTIDLTPIVGQKIFCEFSGGGHAYPSEKQIDYLAKISAWNDGSISYGSEMSPNYVWEGCRIADYWISNADGKLVLPVGLMINVPDHEGDEFIPKCGFTVGRDLIHLGGDSFCNIIEVCAVQVTGPADGYQWGA